MRKMKHVRFLLKLGGDLLWFIKQHCTKQEVSISKTLALRAFSIFLHFSISQISISQISKKLRKMKNIRILLKLGGDLL